MISHVCFLFIVLWYFGMHFLNMMFLLPVISVKKNFSTTFNIYVLYSLTSFPKGNWFSGFVRLHSYYNPSTGFCPRLSEWVFGAHERTSPALHTCLHKSVFTSIYKHAYMSHECIVDTNFHCFKNCVGERQGQKPFHLFFLQSAKSVTCTKAELYYLPFSPPWFWRADFIPVE